MELGWRLDTLPVNDQGVVRSDALTSLLADPTSCGAGVSPAAAGETAAPQLVSVMLANHETGVLQPIEQLAAICRSVGVPLHTDAVAAAGKVPINFRELGVAALSIAAHKFQGPLGIGALIVRQEIAVAPMLFGGHQQEGLRPGTESVALAVGMQTALELWQQEQDEHCRKLTALRDRFEAGLKAGRPDVIVHSEGSARLPQTATSPSPGWKVRFSCWPLTWPESLVPLARHVQAAQRSFLPPCGRWDCPTTSSAAVSDSASGRRRRRPRSTKPSPEFCVSAGNWRDSR